jgi:hypothetical protein
MEQEGTSSKVSTGSKIEKNEGLDENVLTHSPALVYITSTIMTTILSTLYNFKTLESMKGGWNVEKYFTLQEDVIAIATLRYRFMFLQSSLGSRSSVVKPSSQYCSNSHSLQEERTLAHPNVLVVVNCPMSGGSWAGTDNGSSSKADGVEERNARRLS